MLFVVYFQKMVEKGEKLKNCEIKVVKDRSDEDEVEVVRKKVKRVCSIVYSIFCIYYICYR